MSDLERGLPSFSQPPVVEVAAGVEFEPIEGLQSWRLALLWQEFRGRFPLVEEHPPIIPSSDTGVPPADALPLRLQFLNEPTTPRYWFLTEDQSELIQVQFDRIVHNWRRVKPGAEYPLFEDVRKALASELGVFQKFLSAEKMGPLVPRVCEVTYVNHIRGGPVWNEHGQLGEVFGFWSGKHSDAFLPQPTDIQARIRYPILAANGEPLGTLTTVVSPARVDNQPVYLFTLSALVRPSGRGLSEVLAALDVGHQWVVRGFASMTTPRMHQEWGRGNAGTS